MSAGAWRHREAFILGHPVRRPRSSRFATQPDSDGFRPPRPRCDDASPPTRSPTRGPRKLDRRRHRAWPSTWGWASRQPAFMDRRSHPHHAGRGQQRPRSGGVVPRLGRTRRHPSPGPLRTNMDQLSVGCRPGRQHLDAARRNHRYPDHLVVRSGGHLQCGLLTVVGQFGRRRLLRAPALHRLGLRRLCRRPPLWVLPVHDRAGQRPPLPAPRAHSRRSSSSSSTKSSSSSGPSGGSPESPADFS